MAILYISPTGSGTHSGSSAANAGSISDLPRFVDLAGPGGEVRLLADKGPYALTKQITIAAGGEAGAPVTIRGVSSSGQSMSATFIGTRATAWKPGLAEGVELFRLLSGADHLSSSTARTSPGSRSPSSRTGAPRTWASSSSSTTSCRCWTPSRTWSCRCSSPRSRGGSAASGSTWRSPSWASPTAATTTPTSSPAGSSSAWPSRAPSSPTPRSSWPTSPRATWTARAPARSWRSCAG